MAARKLFGGRPDSAEKVNETIVVTTLVCSFFKVCTSLIAWSYSELVLYFSISSSLSQSSPTFQTALLPLVGRLVMIMKSGLPSVTGEEVKQL